MPMKDLVAHEGSGSRVPTAKQTELAGIDFQTAGVEIS